MMSPYTKFGLADSPGAPVSGARKVWWYISGEWEHKGWLMPEIKPTMYRRGK